ncbi:MAG: OmpA family protein, partial [Polyangiales bacterium]
CALAIGCGPSYPKCDDDEDCHGGEYCVNGLCQQCRSDADCEQGQQCASGRCDAIAGYCQSSTDCPPGQECDGNRCVAPMSSSSDTGSGPCELQPVYFGFDADALDGAARSAAQANIQCMKERGIAALQLTGHCDPRGTEEYNLALGDRRARAVLDYMKSLGADANSLASTSMGEEMASGTDEGSWSRDRRVDVRSK